jgi:hypothetical protein
LVGSLNFVDFIPKLNATQTTSRVAVDRPWSNSRLLHGCEELLDVAGCHLRRRFVPERAHDVSGENAVTALVSNTGLGQVRPVLAQRRRRRTLDALEPVEVCVRDLPEGRTLRTEHALSEASFS